MLRHNRIVKCPKCKSVDVEKQQKVYKVRKKEMIDVYTLHRSSYVVAEKLKLVCTCKKCGNKFEKKLGTQKCPMPIWAIPI